MLKLISIRIRNFGSIRNSYIEFPASGLILITGQNKTSHGKLDSVGSGKSLLAESINRTLLGTPGRYTNYGHYSTHGEGNTYIDLKTTWNGQPLRIESGFKCEELSKTGEGLRFQLGDEPPIERGHVNNTREELSRVLGISQELANWTVYLDGDRLKFNLLSQKEKLDLLMSSIAQPRWNELQEKVRTVLSRFKRDKEETTNKLQDCQSELNRRNQEKTETTSKLTIATKNYEIAVSQQQSKLEGVRDKLQGIKVILSDLAKKQETIKKTIQNYQDMNKEDVSTLEKSRLNIDNQLIEAQKEKDRRLENFTLAGLNITEDRNRLYDLQNEPAQCPTCSKPWDKKHSDSEITLAKAKVKTSEENHSSCSVAITESNDKIRELTLEKRAVDVELKDLNVAIKMKSYTMDFENNLAVIHQQELLERELQGQERALLLPPDKSAVITLETLLLERVRNAERVLEKQKGLATALSDAEEACRIGDYWNTAFSPAGIPNLVLAGVIEPLNEASKRLSLSLTGGALDIQYSCARAMASGEAKPELNVVVENVHGSTRLEGNSKGESGLTNLILAETLAEVGRISGRIGYKFYDEVVSNADASVRQNLFGYLHGKAQSGLIFLIDHSLEAANYADGVLQAVKTEEGTEFRWVS